jgi:hypothetical protein
MQHLLAGSGSVPGPMGKARVGFWMICAAVVLAVAAVVMWNNGTADAEDDRLTEGFRASIAGQPADDIDPDRTGPLAAAGVGAVLFLGGIVLVASRSSDS